MTRRPVALGAVAVACTWAISAWVLSPVAVASSSMAPTFCEGSRVLVLRPGAGGSAGAGDVVTFVSPQDGAQWIKRVVAVEGQTVEIDDGRLLVDDVAVDEPYVDLSTVDGTFTRVFSVGPGALFVLGDSREFAVDSRDFGPIPRSSVTGRVVGQLWGGCAS